MRQMMLISMLFALACGAGAKKAEKSRQELASWAATGAVLADDWSENVAYRPYARSTLKVAIAAVEKLETDPQAKNATLHAFAALAKAVESDDRSAAGSEAEVLRVISRKLR